MRLLSEDNRFSLNPALVWIMVIGPVLSASLPAVADADPVKVLFVANGYYQQEDDILDHLNDLGCYEVTTKKDYQIYGSTDLSSYDLIIITEFAPGIGYYGLQNLESSGKPILIVEYWDFWYSYKLGLVEDDWAGYYGTDTVEVINPEHPVASRLGSEIQVYSSSYTVYGIPYNDIKDGVTPLIYSSSSFNEVAVLSDNDRKIAATGIYDTTRYTVRGWMLFDYLLNELYQITPVREDPLSVWDDLIASELLVFLGQVEENPSGWTEDEVLREVWKKMIKWDLFSLSDQINLWVKEIFPELVVIPGIIPVPCPHEKRIDKNGYENRDNKWFLGQNGDEKVNCWVSDYIEGTDLGISTEFYGKLIFYMGDTEIDKNSLGYCDMGSVKCNDAVVESIDNDPSDGIDSSPFLIEDISEIKYQPISIRGFHFNTWDVLEPTSGEIMDFDVFINNWWGFMVPTGAITIGIERPFLEPQQMIAIWYAKGIQKPSDEYPNIHAPYSFVGCSADKIHFYNCYQNYSPSIPFSHDKFINVSPVWVNASDFDRICDNDPLNDMCLLDGSKGGMLLFGNGPEYRRSSLYLAYIAYDDFGELNSEDRPMVSYYTGNSGSPWSSDEDDAMPIIEAIIPQWPDLPTEEDYRTHFGEISVKLIRQGILEGDEAYLVMLYNCPLNPVQHRIAKLSSPWDWTQAYEPSDPDKHVFGYGPFIMEKFTEYDAESETLRLWHTISSWKGSYMVDYGVFTTWTDISPWPPVILE